MPAAASLTLVALDGIGPVAPGDDLGCRIVAAAAGAGLALREDDVVAVAQKIVSKSENQYAVLDEVVPSARALELGGVCGKDPRYVELVLAESRAVLRARIRELAGVDVGVLINDSVGRAWRLGTIGTAIGASGLAGLLDLRGTPDLHGRALQITEVGFADELAAAASAVMGQASEGRPVVVIRGAALARRDGSARELQRPRDQDLFR
jgi:coenzyme F420-0:L-glutamate ligase/coenzyme F420-1:gamma-L-glutamate ligase